MRSADIVDGTIQAVDLGTDSVTSRAIKSNNVKSADLADGAVGSTELATDAVTAAAVQNGTLLAEDLASSSLGSSPRLFAQVLSFGGLDASAGANSISHTSTGLYDVTFNRDVESCGVVATGHSTGALRIFATTVSGPTVHIAVVNQTPQLVDDDFDLVVVC